MDEVYVDISGMNLIDDYDLDYASVRMIVDELLNAKETIIYLKERIRELEHTPASRCRAACHRVRAGRHCCH